MQRFPRVWIKEAGGVREKVKVYNADRLMRSLVVSVGRRSPVVCADTAPDLSTLLQKRRSGGESRRFASVALESSTVLVLSKRWENPKRS